MSCIRKEELQRIPCIFYRVYSSKCADLIRTNKRCAKRMTEDGDDDIVNAIDFNQIKEKVDSIKYTSLNEFLIDFQWFAHNYEILYTSELHFQKSVLFLSFEIFDFYLTNSFSDNDEKTKRAKKLSKLVSQEIDSVKMCLECHINANKSTHWFTMVHRVPHLIIWAQRKNAKYWPAKIMSYDEKQVKVCFFGGYHKQENVPVNKCYLYSRDSPTNIPTKSNDTEFKAALEVNDVLCFYSFYQF